MKTQAPFFFCVFVLGLGFLVGKEEPITDYRTHASSHPGQWGKKRRGEHAVWVKDKIKNKRRAKNNPRKLIVIQKPYREKHKKY